ncbi:hypothetical protein CFE70_007686 [Pyrenophora teres f. teres 0-1]|uniref:Uncharacterized protein n=1 Tax=Pyrenophora teres f. teres (strain 0-1) TaxID=861557 RepID=E3RX26_PYRTT|nr:hypothetical protein PTT_13908 [Pyrenophora teres f. teres 0-1]
MTENLYSEEEEGLRPEVEQLLEEQPIGGVLVAFRNQTIEDPVVIVGLAMAVGASGEPISMVPQAA